MWLWHSGFQELLPTYVLPPPPQGTTTLTAKSSQAIGARHAVPTGDSGGCHPAETAGRRRVRWVYWLACLRMHRHPRAMQTERSPALAPGITPPERIILDELLIRRWQPADLLPRWKAMTASFDHLRPWWDDSLLDLATVDGQRTYGEQAMRWPTERGSFRYGIFDLAETVLGGADLHDRIGYGAIELGYWCHVSHTGNGVITRAAAALTEIALALPAIDRVEIHCDATNTRSAAVARRIGFRLDRIGPREKTAPADSGRAMCWIRHRPARPGS